jgi:hypothetical protein
MNARGAARLPTGCREGSPPAGAFGHLVGPLVGGTFQCWKWVAALLSGAELIYADIRGRGRLECGVWNGSRIDPGGLGGGGGACSAAPTASINILDMKWICTGYVLDRTGFPPLIHLLIYAFNQISTSWRSWRSRKRCGCRALRGSVQKAGQC